MIKIGPLADIIPQYKIPAQPEPDAESEAASQAGQLLFPYIAGIHEQSPANRAETDPAEWEAQIKLIQQGEAEFIGKQCKLGSP